MITVFLTAKKLIALDILQRASTFSVLYFINYIFPDLKIADLNFWRQKTGLTFWVHMDNYIRHNRSKVTSKIKKNHISRIPRPPIHQM
jgi:hypothetical protein